MPILPFLSNHLLRREITEVKLLLDFLEISDMVSALKFHQQAVSISENEFNVLQVCFQGVVKKVVDPVLRPFKDLEADVDRLVHLNNLSRQLHRDQAWRDDRESLELLFPDLCSGSVGEGTLF